MKHFICALLISQESFVPSFTFEVVLCVVAGGQSDQGYDSLSKEEVRLGGGEEQNTSSDVKEKDRSPCE